MKNIVKTILTLMVIATIAIACTTKSESAASEATAADSTEIVAPADSVEAATDTTSVN